MYGMVGARLDELGQSLVIRRLRYCTHTGLAQVSLFESD